MSVPSAPVRLVETLPGVRRATLAAVICGEVATRCDCPSSYLRVLHALVSHAGWHSNRVWASQARLADVAGAIRGICLKTVQRAIRYFVRTLGLRILTEPAERLRGPGEHRYTASGKQKRGEAPVNHYDLSALRRFIPSDLMTLLQREPVSPLPYPLPRRDPSPTDFSDAFPDPFPDPFAETPSPVSPFPLFEKKTRHASSPRLPSLPSLPSLPAPVVCRVALDKTETAETEPETEPETPRSEAPRPVKFERTKLSPVKERSEKTDETEETPASRALARLGISAPMRSRIVETFGETWAQQAVLYARLQETRGEIRTTPAAYLVAVWKTWCAEREAGRRGGPWPDWLQARWARTMRRAAHRPCPGRRGAVPEARAAGNPACPACPA